MDDVVLAILAMQQLVGIQRGEGEGVRKMSKRAAAVSMVGETLAGTLSSCCVQ
jgi:hypothetical protein